MSPLCSTTRLWSSAKARPFQLISSVLEKFTKLLCNRAKHFRPHNSTVLLFYNATFPMNIMERKHGLIKIHKHQLSFSNKLLSIRTWTDISVSVSGAVVWSLCRIEGEVIDPRFFLYALKVSLIN